MCFFKLTQPLTCFFKLTQCNLLYVFLQCCYCTAVKEKGGKPDRNPYPLPYGLRNPETSSLRTLKWPETSMKSYIHEFVFCSHFPSQHWGHCGRDGVAGQESAGGPKKTLRGKIQVRPGAGPGGRASSVSSKSYQTLRGKGSSPTWSWTWRANFIRKLNKLVRLTVNLERELCLQVNNLTKFTVKFKIRTRIRMTGTKDHPLFPKKYIFIRTKIKKRLRIRMKIINIDKHVLESLLLSKVNNLTRLYKLKFMF